MATEQFSAAFDEPKKRFAWPRFVWGETRRERKLRADAIELQADFDRLARRLDADRRAATAALAALREQVDKAIAERDAATAERDDLADRLKVTEAERDSHAQWRSLEEEGRHAAQGERDDLAGRLNNARACLDDAERLLKTAEAERDAAFAICNAALDDARAFRDALERVATDLRMFAEDIECDNGLNDSQDDCPATDCGADGAGTTDEPTN